MRLITRRQSVGCPWRCNRTRLGYLGGPVRRSVASRVALGLADRHLPAELFRERLIVDDIPCASGKQAFFHSPAESGVLFEVLGQCPCGDVRGTLMALRGERLEAPALFVVNRNRKFTGHGASSVTQHTIVGRRCLPPIALPIISAGF